MERDPFARWPELDRLFAEVLETPPSDRRAYLDAACVDDAPLRQELERLLAAHAAEDGFLETPAPWLGELATTREVEPTEAPRGWIGRTVSHYEILDEVGSGGMGVVYKARDTKLDRSVTLKFLQPYLLSDATAKTRFIHEAQAASALDHPHICTIHEIGETDDGQLFIAMAYYEGETLKDRIGRGPLPHEDTVRIGEQIADALEQAHEAAIVHRDLKPANVMLTARGEVKLLDFGIAKLEGGSQLTGRGELMGTVAYMSPEQARGDAVDPRMDVWALGVVLYEMVTGKRPFRGDHAQAVIHAILDEDPVPLVNLRPDAPAALQGTVSRALAKDPAERFPTMADLRRDLRRLHRGFRRSSSVLRVRGPAGAAAKPLRGRWLTGLAALGAVGLIAAATQVMSFGTVPFEERDWLLIADLENRTGDSLFDGSLDGLLNSSIAQSKRINVYPSVRVREILRRMERPPSTAVDEPTALEIAERAGIQAVLVPNLTAVGDAYALSARVVDPASGVALESFVERAEEPGQVLEATERLARGVRRSLGETRLALRRDTAPLPFATTASLQALKAFADGNREWQAGRLRQAGATWQVAIRHDSTFTLAHASLGMYYHQLNDRSRGDAHLDRALANLDRVTRPERLWIQSQAATARGQRDQAVNLLEAYVEQYPDVRDAWFNLGSNYMRLRVCDDADRALDQALRIDPTLSQAHIQAATCRTATQEFGAALARYERAFAIDSSLLVWGNLNHEYGNTLVKSGDPRRAEAAFRRMLEGSGRQRAAGLRSLGMLAMYRGHMKRAVTLLDASTGAYTGLASPLSVFRNQLYLVVAYGSLGNAARFRALLDSAAELSRSIPMEPNWLMLLGRLYARDGDVARAEEQYTAMEPLLRERNRRDLAARDFLRGELLLARGEYDEAVRALVSAQANRDDGLFAEALARAYALAGDTTAAIEQFERTIEFMGLGWEAQQPWIQAHVELGRLLEARGDTVEAVAYYRRFVELWADADPDITPSVADARERIRALGGAASH